MTEVDLKQGFGAATHIAPDGAGGYAADHQGKHHERSPEKGYSEPLRKSDATPHGYSGPANDAAVASRTLSRSLRSRSRMLWLINCWLVMSAALFR